MSGVAGLSDIQVSLIFFGYIIIFLASLFGNSIIIHIIRTNNSMKTTTNYLILNQACADIVTTLESLFNAVHYTLYHRRWFGGIGGLITCKIFQASRFILPTFSIWILAIIAIERYYAVARPLQSSPISQHFKKSIALLWAWSICSLASFFVKNYLDKVNETFYCDVMTVIHHWTEFNIISLISNVFLPLLILAVLYTRVCIKLWSRKVPGDGANCNQGQADAIKTAKKVTRMMLAIVFFFLFCWLPFLVAMALQLSGYVQISYSVFLFPIWLTAAYSGLNPYIYVIFNVNFRWAFKRLLRNIYRVVPYRSQRVELQQM